VSTLTCVFLIISEGNCNVLGLFVLLFKETTEIAVNISRDTKHRINNVKIQEREAGHEDMRQTSCSLCIPTIVVVASLHTLMYNTYYIIVKFKDIIIITTTKQSKK